jgi:hypothetical protein
MMTPDTLLHRQVNPSWVQDGRVTSQLFKPSPKDDGRLSVYDGDRISAPAAWAHFTRILGFLSVGVMSVTATECATHGLPVEPDPEPFPEHAIIRFVGLSPNEVRKRAKYLTKAAQLRGWQYRPEQDSPGS